MDFAKQADNAALTAVATGDTGTGASIESLEREILELKSRLNTVIPAHNYQIPEYTRPGGLRR